MLDRLDSLLFTGPAFYYYVAIVANVLTHDCPPALERAMKNIVILGSTGSIGTNTLDIVDRFPQEFRVIGLTAGSNDDKLEAQIRRFRPAFAAQPATKPPRENCDNAAPTSPSRSSPARKGGTGGAIAGR